jgi:ABC-type amino acid transport substrate-binding protein
MKQKSMAILMLCLAAGGIVGYLSLNNRSLISSPTVTLGTMSGWPPYVSIDQAGAYQGIDIDIAHEIARRLNKKLSLKDMDTASLITALTTGSVDFIMTGLSITNERLEKIAMIPYQGDPIKELPLVFWDTLPAITMTSLADLAKLSGATICVEAGSSQEEVISKVQGLTIKYCDPVESLLELKYGRATAALLEPTLYQEFKRKYPNLKAVMIPLDEKSIILGNGIGIKKENQQLIKDIQAIVHELKQNGFIKACEERWLKKAKQENSNVS